MFGLKTRTLCSTLLVLVFFGSRALANNINVREKEIATLKQILANGTYDARIRPTGASGIYGIDDPVVVRVNMFVRDISSIDDARQEFSVQLTFRHQWMDERLKFDDMGGRLKYLTLSASDQIWLPDLFFSNEKESHFHNMLMPNTYVRLLPTGSILRSMRISLTLDCSMNFKLYPFDRQSCDIRIASYGSTAADVKIIWKDYDSVQVKRDLYLQGFTLGNFSTGDCTSKTGTAEYSCLKVNFAFERSLVSYLIRIYIPCCVLVLASFVSFWLDKDAVAARVLLGIATLLGMVFQISNVSASLPPVAYVKAMDIWTVACLIFIFGTLLEFATLNYTSHYDDMKEKCEPANLIQDESKESMKTWSAHYNHFRAWLSNISRSRKIDIASRITFPISFALFNLVYWIVYLNRAERSVNNFYGY